MKKTGGVVYDALMEKEVLLSCSLCVRANNSMHSELFHHIGIFSQLVSGIHYYFILDITTKASASLTIFMT